MKQFLSTIIIIVCCCWMQIAHAQQENNYWFFGKGLGMWFTNASASKLNAPAHASDRYITSTSTMSDRHTGKLLFYTNGRTIYNRNHSEMTNGGLLGNYNSYVLIVPDAADTLQYFVFFTNNHALYYSKVDMRLNGGMGGITQANILYLSNIDNRFTAVKLLYNAGYWIITHQLNSRTFQSTRLTRDGLETNIRYSTTDELMNWPDAVGFYSEIITNTTGDLIAVMDNDGSKPNEKFISIFEFDKQCGTVTLKKQLFSKPFFYDIAFDAQSKFLYIITSQGGGDKNIIQYELAANNKLIDTLPASVLITSQEPMRKIKLAPDNKLYISKEELIGNGYSPSRYIDVINNPSVKGIGCNYVEKVMNLSPNNACFNDPCYLTDRFPNFIHDRTIQQPLNMEEPTIQVDGSCFGVATTFELLTNNLYADSIQWDFGDTSYSILKKNAHIYKYPGVYIASFNWYLCGLKYSIKKTIQIGVIPNANLGKDTILCYGTSMKLTANAAEHYKWSTGDTTASIIIKDKGIYAVTLANGNCTASGSITIDYYKQLWTMLGDEYFICDRDKELVKLDAGNGFVTYKWTPTGDTSQWIIVGDLGNYFVVVKDYRGCEGSDGTFVKRICPVELFFPTIFTPNDDGLNDTYLPIGNSIITYNLKIYNRWGQLVFETSNITEGWNGKYLNAFAPTDSYVYTCSYSGYINKRLTPFYTKGTFTLLR